MNFFSLFKRNIFYKFKKKVNIDLDNVNQSSLDELLRNFGSDKANYLQNKQDIGHGFTKFYTNNLDHLKKKKIKILEIGSYAGASAASFVKYFENSTVYCFDVNISKFDYQSKNIQVYGLDINNKTKLDKTLKKINLESNSNFFDIIIDDGSHKQSDQLNTLNHFYQYLVDGGFYVIEDYKFSDYFKHLNDIDDIKIDELADHVLKKKQFSSSLVSSRVIDLLLNTTKNVYKYKGNTDISDIVFFEKN